MILIADSGSTKTIWNIINDDIQVRTIGLNPHILSSELMIKEIMESELFLFKDEVSFVFFYGSGCGSKDKCEMVKEALSCVFSKAQIIVESDLIGAARALFGNSLGMVGILGTGSNICLYDGEKINESIVSQGYMLGDEGGGVYLGKLWLKNYLSNRVPEHIKQLFDEQHHFTKETIIDRIYRQPRPNVFIASMVPFLFEQRKEDFVAELIRKNMHDYFDAMVSLIPNYTNYSLKTIGSVGYFFQEELKDVAKQWSVEVDDSHQNPILGLKEFHKIN